MERRIYIVLLAAALLVIGAPSLLFAQGGVPTAKVESFRVGGENCYLNVGFNQLTDEILKFSATPDPLNVGFYCETVCESECETFCYPLEDLDEEFTVASAPATSAVPFECDISDTRLEETYVCPKQDCKPNRNGTYDCTDAVAGSKCEQRQSVHRRTAERLGNNTQVCVTDRTGRRICVP